MVGVGIKPGTFQTGVQRLNHSATVPPTNAQPYTHTHGIPLRFLQTLADQESFLLRFTAQEVLQHLVCILHVTSKMEERQRLEFSK